MLLSPVIAASGQSPDASAYRSISPIGSVYSCSLTRLRCALSPWQVTSSCSICASSLVVSMPPPETCAASVIT